MQLFDYDRATSIMNSVGIDVILATSRHGVGYLSDYWHPVSDQFYVLWDAEATHMTVVRWSSGCARTSRVHRRGCF